MTGVYDVTLDYRCPCGATLKVSGHHATAEASLREFEYQHAACRRRSRPAVESPGTLLSSGCRRECILSLEEVDQSTVARIGQAANGRPLAFYVSSAMARPRSEGGTVDLDIVGYLAIPPSSASRCDECGQTARDPYQHLNSCSHWRP
jgi:hypothetical protein